MANTAMGDIYRELSAGSKLRIYYNVSPLNSDNVNRPSREWSALEDLVTSMLDATRYEGRRILRVLDVTAVDNKLTRLFIVDAFWVDIEILYPFVPAEFIPDTVQLQNAERGLSPVTLRLDSTKTQFAPAGDTLPPDFNSLRHYAGETLDDIVELGIGAADSAANVATGVATAAGGVVGSAVQGAVDQTSLSSKIFTLGAIAVAVGIGVIVFTGKVPKVA